MYSINFRVGILFRENLAKKSYQIRYFFIDNEANIFYLSSLARLQKVIRLSADFKQVKQKLVQFGEKSFSLHKYHVTNPHQYNSQAVLPFCNRTCIQIKQNQGKQQRFYQLFGFIDEDTALIHHQILVLTGKKKVELNKRKSVIEDQKNKQQIKLQQFFHKYIQNQQKFKMQNIKQQNKQVEFIGQMQRSKAEGKCSQTLLNEGISYTGYFKNGKKHGTGLLVSAQLDSLDCDFLDDQLVGI